MFQPGKICFDNNVRNINFFDIILINRKKNTWKEEGQPLQNAEGLRSFMILSKKSIIITVLCLIFIPLLTSCTQESKTAAITLYYTNEDNSKILTEDRQVKVTRDNPIHRLAVEELLKGPTKQGLKSTIPSGTKLLDIEVEDKIATVNLSKEFSGFPGIMAESFALISVVNTLSDLPDIQKVQVLVEGKDLIAPSGNPYGPLSRYDVEDINRDLSKADITLYFSDEQAMYLVPEIRQVVKDKPVEQIIVEQLIKGPEKAGLYPTIPKGTSLISIEVKDGTAYVNFSEEFKTNHWGGSAGEAMTIYSIVNSLTELPNIKQVMFLIEGREEETLAGHFAFNEPFRRVENIIKR